jgi:hypothetical protein
MPKLKQKLPPPTMTTMTAVVAAAAPVAPIVRVVSELDLNQTHAYPELSSPSSVTTTTSTTYADAGDSTSTNATSSATSPSISSTTPTTTTAAAVTVDGDDDDDEDDNNASLQLLQEKERRVVLQKQKQYAHSSRPFLEAKLLREATRTRGTGTGMGMGMGMGTGTTAAGRRTPGTPAEEASVPPSLISPAFTPPATPGLAAPVEATALYHPHGQHGLASPPQQQQQLLLRQPASIPVDSTDAVNGGAGLHKPKLLDKLPTVNCIVGATIPT